MFRRFSARVLAVFIAAAALAVATPAASADQVYFSKDTNVTNILVNYINQETVRLDISSWYLSEHSISIAIANRWAAGVPVRIIGDRGAIFEADPHTKAEFYWLANQGIPIRLRFNPTWFPEIDHWKAAIFVGQNMIEFGSGNFAPTELAPISSTNYDDDSEMFTTDPDLVNAFKTKFDVMWNDTTTEPESMISGPPYLKNWDDACASEPTGNCADYHTQYPNPAPMVVNTARLEPDNPMPADLIWGQGPDFNNRLIQEINNENAHVDIVVYRMEVPELMQALLNKFKAGVPVRIIVDPHQYTDIVYPEYWLSHAYIDQLWAAGVPILQTMHLGVTHLKTLITSTYATNGSSNFAPLWQRDHDYFISASTKPTIYQAFVDNFNEMWNDTTNYGPLVPTPANAVDLTAPGTSPSDGQSAVNVGTAFTWNAAAWATSYDVYLGTTSNNMQLVANVPAVLSMNPPSTYSWTPQAPLSFGTQYAWKVVSRTFANKLTSSDIKTFTTADNGSQAPTTPANPAPSTGANGVSTTPTLTWTSAGATSYAINFGTTNPPPSTGTNTGGPSYTPGMLAANTAYYWQIVATNTAGSTSGPVWSFTTSTGNLPSPWQSQDVGATGQTGSSTFSDPTFTIRGAGADIWGSDDGFQFAYQTLTGDGQIVARVVNVQNTSSFAKGGIMLRDSLSSSAANVILDLRPTGDIEFMSRASDGGSTSYLAGATQAAPVWLKLARSGSTITGSVSADGTTWTTVGSTSIALPSALDAGLIVSSHDTSTLNTSTFDSVSVVATGPVPGAPTTPSPASSATGVATTPTLTWTSANATSDDVAFGTSNPPLTVATGQAAASYSPGALATATTYFWQITAHNANGTTAGPVWSFTTAAAAPTDNIVVYASDIPPGSFHGTWTTTTDSTAAAGITAMTPDNGVANTTAPLASPSDYVDVTFDAPADVPYTFWMRVKALNNSKYNDSVYVQFSDALVNGSAVYAMNSTQGLVVNLATDTTGSSLNNWGWVNGAYWLSQPATVTFASGGTHTLRIQVREDGAEFDQIVLSPSQYFNSAASCPTACTDAPGPVSNDATIVPKPAPPAPPAAPSSPSPASGATSVSTSQTLTWVSSGATSYDVAFGTATPPPTVTTGQAGASYGATGLAANTIYYWQITAHNSAGTTAGPVWSFTTQAPPPPPGAPGSPSPASGATGVTTSPALTWTATGAAGYDVFFGTTNPPPQVASNTPTASYSPAALSTTTTYYWQVVARNAGGTTSGPVWSFTTASGPQDIVIYASDLTGSNVHGSVWAFNGDATAANSTTLFSLDNGVENTGGASASPTDYVDVPFTATAGVPYTLWIRLKALNNSKYNDSLFVQFSDAQSSGSPIYAIGTTQGLVVNLATDSGASSLNNWGWANGAYWLSQPATVTFASDGAHTLRLQIREDGFSIDQIVLSPSTYYNPSASCPTTCGGSPGTVSNDSVIVPKP